MMFDARCELGNLVANDNVLTRLSRKQLQRLHPPIARRNQIAGAAQCLGLGGQSRELISPDK
jgi:hypothetical protein